MSREEIKVNQFKIWLVSNGIKQKKLSEKSGVGVTSLHHMINEGVASDETIDKVSLSLRMDFGKEIDSSAIFSMICK